ncbi:hypothetical protein LZK76_10920 [Rhizobium leguminosarum]|nr:hypothetical protein LZK76_10920 [Rhizobium leguminosarum]
MSMANQANSAFQGPGSATLYQMPNRGGASRAPVTSYNNHWWPSLQARFNELASLEKGWDGYQGRPVIFTVATFAANLLERICIEGISEPALVPGSDGTMQIEWHKNGFDVEIDVLGPNKVVAMRYDHKSGQEEVVELENDFSVLLTWMSDLASARDNLEAANA